MNNKVFHPQAPQAFLFPIYKKHPKYNLYLLPLKEIQLLFRQRCDEVRIVSLERQNIKRCPSTARQFWHFFAVVTVPNCDLKNKNRIILRKMGFFQNKVFSRYLSLRFKCTNFVKDLFSGKISETSWKFLFVKKLHTERIK